MLRLWRAAALRRRVCECSRARPRLVRSWLSRHSVAARACLSVVAVGSSLALGQADALAAEAPAGGTAATISAAGGVRRTARAGRNTGFDLRGCAPPPEKRTATPSVARRTH